MNLKKNLLVPITEISKQKMNAIFTGMTILFFIIWLAPLPSSMQQMKFMPLWLHITCETFSIVVAMMVFGITWNSYKAERNGNLLILACGLLAVGLLDFIHMLSFKGMPDFITPSGAEKGINFGLAARFVVALTLLTIAVSPWRPFKSTRSPYLLLGSSLGITFLAAWLGLYHQDLWPATFIEGEELTGFKTGSEYVISSLILMAAFLFYRSIRRGEKSLYDAHSLFAASYITILSDLSFVLFAHFADVFHLLGHLYKICAYIFIYRAAFISSVRAPFNDLKAVKEKLAVSERMLQSILDNVPVRIFWKDLDLCYLGANKLFLEDAGVSNVSEIIGKRSADFFPEHDDLYIEVDRTVIHTAISKLDYEEPIKMPDGKTVWALTSKVPLRNSEGTVTGVLATYSDITERKQAEQIIEFQANYDLLTQLPNRRLFNDRLEQESKKSSRSGQRFALVLLDLDNFKEVNDTFGHIMGDELLKQVAQRLKDSLRQTDTVARLGGDEFTIIIGGVDGPGRAELVAQKVLNVLAEPFQLQEDKIYLTVSIGLTIYPDDANSTEDMLRNVDQAMYAAKQQGRNRYSYFTSSMQIAAQNRLQLTKDLRIAIAENRFTLVYQPIVELSTWLIRKAEALIRWDHPQRGLVSPAEFIPIAETTGLIVEIGDWVFYEACRQVKRWRECLASDFQISINKSPVQFTHKTDGFGAWFDHLKELGLPGESIVIEITEGLVLNADTPVKDLLKQYRDAGIEVSLDDFGTGYSSLTYLKKFDIDYIKIDRSFVSNLSPGSEDLALCEAIIVMAHKLGMEAIAEGVETKEQLDLLVGAGCDYGQGYWFSSPVPADKFEKLLKWPGV